MRLLPVSLDAVLVELDDLDETMALFEALQQEPVEGVLDMVPAARTVLIQFDPTACSRERLVAAVMRHRGGKRVQQTGTLVQLPLRYDGEDLDEMAAYLKVSRAELIRRHAESIWQVAFAGFAPGFPYMTCSDSLFNVPRRSSPRTRIPAGSVGLAGQFCGIYPRATPGGWQLIGTTDVPMWDLNRNPPAFLQPGQRVQFVDVESEAGARVLEQILTGRPTVDDRGVPHADGVASVAADPVGAGGHVVVPGTAAGRPDAAPPVRSAHPAQQTQNGSEAHPECIPVGTVVHNIELKPGHGGELVRAAGASAQVLGQEGKYALVRLQSGEVRMVLGTCRATVGIVGNEQHGLVNLGKAGRSRWKGIRPTVRGSVMNPNDHPHGGGEGKAPVGRKAPSTPWGKPALGLKTRNKKAKSDKLIVRRRNQK